MLRVGVGSLVPDQRDREARKYEWSRGASQTEPWSYAESYTCLEPDAALCAELEARLANHAKPPRVVCGTLEAMGTEERFDRSVGHFRRYTRRSLSQVTPRGLSMKDWFYLDGVGVLASLFARFAKRSAPTLAQIGTWDKAIVPVSRVTDFLTSRLFGRTIIMVWIKD